MLLPNLLKMPFFFLYFAVLSVHHYILNAAIALPVQDTTLTPAHKTDIKQIETLSKLFPSNFGNSEHSYLGLSFKHMQKEKFQEPEKKKEFQPCKVSNKTFQHKERRILNWKVLQFKSKMVICPILLYVASSYSTSSVVEILPVKVVGKIPRADPCEICVCIDSEMYCFWKLCTFFNLTTVTPSPQTASKKAQQTLKQPTSDNNLSLASTNATVIRENKMETTDEKFSKILKDQRKHNALKKLEATSPKTSDFGNAKTQNVSSSTEKPTICYVMGVIYKYGEILPRDTGTCLECACSEGGRVSCSPKDCVSQPDLDYLSHNNNLDMFELDTF